MLPINPYFVSQTQMFGQNTLRYPRLLLRGLRISFLISSRFTDVGVNEKHVYPVRVASPSPNGTLVLLIPCGEKQAQQIADQQRLPPSQNGSKSVLLYHWGPLAKPHSKVGGLWMVWMDVLDELRTSSSIQFERFSRRFWHGEHAWKVIYAHQNTRINMKRSTSIFNKIRGKKLMRSSPSSIIPPPSDSDSHHLALCFVQEAPKVQKTSRAFSE